MGVMLTIDKKQQCVGCRQCETICSIAHHGIFVPWYSRIHILRNESVLECTPVICRQCGRAKCAAACPVEAIRPDKDRVLRIDESLCMGCGACIDACPFHAIYLHEEKKKALKCDLCGGEVRCAAVCPAHVLVRKER